MKLEQTDSLLLECLKSDPDVSGLGELSPSDWGAVIKQSVRHSVAPLVYRNLKQAGQNDAIPADVLRRLQELYNDTLATNIRLYHNLSVILKVLKENYIPVILLKGDT